ncbi:AfsR/SARP family transcriptional regulator [Streptomyces iconiensis]|uniref:AfsR/SARP family transcriptional regulator n=1 Tax=Streptomyces iconiensis TaxID=1384038 RepID=A0ABT6ZPI7_9ACTN|nr:AfsR/SARP family transcriptional regulator [Streptomyces iconiensis]MDJ1130971.1 AfsR/SARP family transcriptional regulator [Streptomyces iconiensis]
MRVEFGVLGPVTAWDGEGNPIALKGPRHRAVLARLILARRRVVPVARLVDDLWAEDPPAGAVSAVRTFVGALRRALEPERAPHTPAGLLVTEGPGYALRAGPDAVDAWRFERAVAATPPPAEALARLEEALGWWRGPAYADFAGEPWARTERSRLAELRLRAVERHSEARLALGLAAEAVPDLDAHVAEHPWREDAWRLLALALYRAGRQGDALAVLRRARTMLVEELGLDPGPGLRRLEADVLDQARHLELEPGPGQGGEPGPGREPSPGPEPSPGREPEDPGDSEGPGDAAERVWARAAAAYDRTVASGARARLESTVSLLRNLAVTGAGGLEAARQHRLAAVTAAEELGDPELTARVIGTYDVPAIWTRSDDPEQAAHLVAAAERTLAALPPGAHEPARARLLATVALESRGTNAARGLQAARQAEETARGLDDPALLAFALNALYMQMFHRTGLAPERDAIGAELIALSLRHGLVAYEIVGRLIRVQALSALGDFATADEHAHAADRLAARHERPLVSVFTQLYRALRLAATSTPPKPGTPPGPGTPAPPAPGTPPGPGTSPGRYTSPAEAEAAYLVAAAPLSVSGMPGLEHGLLPLALLSLRLLHGLPAQTETTDWGPYEPWARPLVLLAQNREAEAAATLRAVPDPPGDLLLEALWCLTARAALAVGDREVMERAHRELAPAGGELAGAGSGVLTLGPVAGYLQALTAG